MTVWIAFAAGIFVGWVIEWIIDWLYWRRNLAGFYATETQLRNELAAAQARLDELSVENEALRAQLASAPERTLAVPLADGEEEVDDEAKVVIAEAGDAEPDGEEADAEVVVAVESDETPGEAVEAAGVAAAAAAVEEAGTTEDPIAEPAPEAEEATAAPAQAPQLDNLTRINGIGPVYRRKLHEAGVGTFAQLAASTPEELTAIIQPAEYQKPAFAQWITDAGLLAAQPAGDDDPDASTGEEE
jgi:predicted flap endonuclease-1-like 5' DNA nuclease